MNIHEKQKDDDDDNDTGDDSDGKIKKNIKSSRNDKKYLLFSNFSTENNQDLD